MIDIETLDLWNQPDEGDPLVWLRKNREELDRKKRNMSFEEQKEYYKQVGTVEDALKRVRKQIAEKQS